MSKHKKKFLVFFVLIFTVACVAITSPITVPIFRTIKVLMSGISDDGFNLKLNKLASRYKNEEISIIDLSSITPITWDRLYFFSDYAQIEEIEATVGKSWVHNDNCFEKVLLANNDVYNLLIFTNKNVVVYCVARPHNKYSINIHQHAFGKPGFSPQEALFIVDDDDYLVLKEKE